MSLAQYFVEVSYTCPGDSAPAWHLSNHETLQGARRHARHYAQLLGRENVGLYQRYPKKLDF